jgi:hypothetical protein
MISEHRRVVRIVVCSSVETDYIRYLADCVAGAGDNIRVISVIQEIEYRASLRKCSRAASWWLRFRMYIQYPVELLWRIASESRTTVWIVTSNTFYAPMLARMLGGGRIVVHLLYDLYPDALEVARRWPARSLRSNVLGWVTRCNLRDTSATVFLGRELAAHAINRWGSPPFAQIIHVGADERSYKERSSGNGLPLKFHYGGQLGYMHDAEGLAACVRAACSVKSRVSFNFMISGARAGWFQEKVSDLAPAVEVCSPLPSELWRERVREFDLGLVTLSEGGATVCLPSKTYSMMAAGLAIIALCPAWSDLAHLITSSESGWVIDNSGEKSVEQQGRMFAELVKWLQQEEGLTEMRRRQRNGQFAARTRFGHEQIRGEWSTLLRAVGEGGSVEYKNIRKIVI